MKGIMHTDYSYLVTVITEACGVGIKTHFMVDAPTEEAASDYAIYLAAYDASKLVWSIDGAVVSAEDGVTGFNLRTDKVQMMADHEAEAVGDLITPYVISLADLVGSGNWREVSEKVYQRLYNAGTYDEPSSNDVVVCKDIYGIEWEEGKTCAAVMVEGGKAHIKQFDALPVIDVNVYKFEDGDEVEYIPFEDVVIVGRDIN